MRYQIFWEVVGLERGPLSLVSAIEELLQRKSNGFSIENRNYGNRDPPNWPRDTLYLHKLTLTSPTSGGRSVGVVRSRTQATEFVLIYMEVKEIQKFHLLSYNAIQLCPILRMSRSMRMRWTGNVERLRNKRDLCRILVGKSERERPLARLRRGWVNNVKIDLGDIGWVCVDWIGPAQDRQYTRAFLNTVMNFRPLWSVEKFMNNLATVGFSRRTSLLGVSLSL
jgi:hypothetical protein